MSILYQIYYSIVYGIVSFDYFSIHIDIMNSVLAIPSPSRYSRTCMRRHLQLAALVDALTHTVGMIAHNSCEMHDRRMAKLCLASQTHEEIRRVDETASTVEYTKAFHHGFG